MMLHFWSRPAFVFTVGAPFVALACSLAGSAAATSHSHLSYAVNPSSFVLIQARTDRSRAKRPVKPAGVRP